MHVVLFTGLPGAGKTAQLVAEIVRLREVEPGRPLFAMGINGLKEGLAIPLTMEMLDTWWELPPGSIIALDECQEDHLMPKDRGNPQPWVQRITKVRHYGMTFLLTTQDPCNMSAYVRRLVDKHVHTIRKFGTSVVQRYTWGRCIDDPYNRREQKNAVSDVSTLPAKVFDLYKSSSLHTTKKRIPRQVWLLVAVLVLFVCAVVSVPFALHRFRQKNANLVSAHGSASHTSAQHSKAEDESMRRSDVAKWMRPRVEGIPWTAPMFDGLQVQAQPRLYCIAVDDGRCTCNTEQGTRVQMDLKQCRAIVENGLYNPFIPPTSPADPRAGKDASGSEPGRREAASPPADQVQTASSSPAFSAGEWKDSAVSSAYVQPELMKRPDYQPHTSL